MTLLTGETEVFSAATHEGRWLVAFLVRQQTFPDRKTTLRLEGELSALADEGWVLSIRRMFDSSRTGSAWVLDTGFASAYDFAGVFEAPDLSAALDGTVRLEDAGWKKCFNTEWLIGPREFATVNGVGPETPREWGFLAFWEWNDQWTAASPEERVKYDAECDVAFKGDLAFNINIAGRHRLDWAHSWHHIGIWESPSLGAIDRAIRGHEVAADFKFTTSRHLIGKITPFSDLLTVGRAS